MTKNPEFNIDEELAKFEAEERAKLGLQTEEREQWTDAMVNPFFTASQRETTTILCGGLTIAHDTLVEGALKGLGYQVRALEVPDNASLRFGKEFGNRGQCNPTYFTVGNLVKELCRLRDEEGMTSEEVIDRYIFCTAGACGPCRFGMYVTEYRKALRDAGFDGFRVVLFQQTGGFKQATGEELGLVLNPEFFITLGKALFSGDVINIMQYRLRAYETEPGATDRAIDKTKNEVYDALANRKSVIAALFRSRKYLRQVPIDRTMVKPKVHILGEFWAMITEGDGSYHLQKFLHEEGAENDIQIVSNVLLYNLWEFRHDTMDRATLKGADGGRYGLDGNDDIGLTMAGLYVGDALLRLVFQTFAHALGLYGHVLPDMDEVAKVGHSHYNVNLRGGEGHLEVAKLILNVVKNKCHMTISVKPFGCMPSSGVSDGVQSVVTELYPQAIFCAVETNGDGAVNFYSRVQMFLFKARLRAQEEMEETLKQHGVTLEQVREFVEGTRYAHHFHKSPHVAAGTAADLVHEVAPLIGKGRLGRAKVHAGRAVASTRYWFEKSLPKKAAKAREVAPFLPGLVRWVGNEAAEALAPKELWNKMLGSFVKPTEEEQQQIEAAEAAPPERVRPPKDKQLSVMA